MTSAELYTRFGAEALQHDDEQSQAEGWSIIWAIAIGCFLAGMFVTVALEWIWSLFL